MPRQRHPTTERQRQIADVALELLGSRGLVGLTAKNIGGALGISDAAVFKHYENKDAIIEAAISRFEALLDEPAIPSESAPLEQLRLFFIGRVALVRAHPVILGLAFSDRLELAAGEDGAERVRQIMSRSVAFVKRCLRDAQSTGDLRDRATPEVLAWMVLGALRATATRRTGRASPERIWEQVAATLT